MLNIIVNGSQIELGDTRQIAKSRKSNLFNYSSFDGSFTFPFNVPVTDYNRPIFKYCDQKFTKNKSFEFPVEVWHSNVFQFAGTITVNNIINGNYDCDCKIDGSDFFNTVGNKKLKQCEFGGEIDFILTNSYDPDNIDYCVFPVQIKDYVQNGTTKSIYANWWSTLFDVFLSSQTLDPTLLLQQPSDVAILGNSKYHNVIIPFPFLNNILKKIFTEHGYIITHTFLDDDTELKNLCMFNNYSVVEYKLDGLGGIYADTSKMKLINHLPDLTISDFLFSVKNIFNCDFQFKGNKVNIRSIDSIILDENYIDWSDKFMSFTKKTIQSDLNGVELKWQFPETDPNFYLSDTGEDIINYVVKDEVDENIFPLFPVKVTDIIKKNAAPADGDFYKGKVETAGGYIVDFVTLSSSDYASYVKGNRDLKFETQFGTYFDRIYAEIVDSGLHGYTLPFILEEDSSYYKRDKVAATFARLMFFRGARDWWKSDTSQYRYLAFGTKGNTANDNYNNIEIQVGNRKMSWYGENGLYKNFWENTIRWLQKRGGAFECLLHLTATDLKNFDEGAKIKFNNSLWFVQNMDYVIRNNDISIVKAVVYKAY